MRSRTIYIILVFVLLVLPAAATLIAGGEEAGEREEITADLTSLEGLGSWFETHFAGRSSMITMNALLKRSFLGSSYGDEIIIGKDGYLFYEGTLDDYFRRNPMTERELFIAAYNLSLMQEYCEANGASFIFMLCSNKNTLYPQYMPDHYLQGEGKTNTARLLPYLDQLGVHYIDMYPVLAGREDIYFRRDTHWTQAGALYGYEAVMEALGRPLLNSEEGVWNTQKHAGDLEQMLLPDAYTLEEAPVRHIPWQYSADEEASAQNVHTENVQGTGSLLMFRDSFGTDLLPYLAQTYARCWFTQVWPCIMDDVQAADADDVILEKVERNLPDLTKRPLIMQSPQITPGIYEIRETETLVVLEPEGPYIRIWAEVPSSLTEDETRMYIGTDAGAGQVYRAVLSVGTDAEGPGCYICVPRDSLQEKTELEVYLEDGGSWCRIFRGSAQIPPSWHSADPS